MAGSLPPEVSDDDADERPTVAVEPRREAAPETLSVSDFVVSDVAPGDDSAPDSLIGKTLGGRYRIDALLGEGGMGAVYRGEHVRMRKRVAVKVLRPDVEHLPDLVARFEREAIAGAHVQHANVAAATDFGQLDDGSYYLVLEFVDGERLSDLIERGPLPSGRAARIACGVAEALVAVHEKGIVHRDLKPQNVMIVDGYRVKLIDFGLAKVPTELVATAGTTRSGIQLTATGTVVGTVAYLAPEAALGMEAVGARADLYALGVILYQMLSGRQPFEGKDNVSLFRHQRFSPPPRIAERAPGVAVPAALEAVALRMLAKSPAERYETAADVVRALAALVDTAAGASIPAPPSSRSSRGPLALSNLLGGRHRSLPSLVAGVGSLPARARNAVIGIALVLVLCTVVFVNRRLAVAPAPPRSTALDPPAPAVVPAGVAAPPGRPLVEGADATVWRARLRSAVDQKAWDNGGRAFLALAEIDAPALDEGGVRADVTAVAAGVAFEGNDVADRVFEAMADAKLGARGPDLLFEIVRTRGNTRAARRAIEVLRRPEVFARGTPELRIAFDFRQATCDRKPELFDRAADEGDGRTLAQLVAQKDTDCKRKDPCCYRANEHLADAIKRLKARLIH